MAIDEYRKLKTKEERFKYLNNLPSDVLEYQLSCYVNQIDKNYDQDTIEKIEMIKDILKQRSLVSDNFSRCMNPPEKVFQFESKQMTDKLKKIKSQETDGLAMV